MAREGELLEWAEVFGHRYGTPVRLVQEALERGEDIVLGSTSRARIRSARSCPRR